MNLQYGNETIEQVRKLKQAGIQSMIVFMRHSAREYNIKVPDEQNLLTDEGRDFAFQFGKALPPGEYRLFSSLIERCVDTSNHIDKGLRERRSPTTTNQKIPGMEFFYNRDLKKVFEFIRQAGGIPEFLRKWFDGQAPEDAIQDSNSASQVIMAALKNRLALAKENTIDICVSHDWNLYLVKEKYMDLPHEVNDKVEYLDGLFLYQNDGRSFITNHQTDPVEIR